MCKVLSRSGIGVYESLLGVKKVVGETNPADLLEDDASQAMGDPNNGALFCLHAVKHVAVNVNERSFTLVLLLRATNLATRLTA